MAEVRLLVILLAFEIAVSVVPAAADLSAAQSFVYRSTWIAGATSTLSIQLVSTDGTNFTSPLPAGAALAVSAWTPWAQPLDIGNFTYVDLGVYTSSSTAPTVAAFNYTLTATIDGTPLINSPFNWTVFPDSASSAYSWMSMSANPAQIRAGNSTPGLLYLGDRYNNSIYPGMQGRGQGSTFTLINKTDNSVIHGEGSLYTSWNASAGVFNTLMSSDLAGSFIAEYQVNTFVVPGGPFELDVIAGPASVLYTTVSGAGLSTSTATCPSTFVITGRDRYNNRCTVGGDTFFVYIEDASGSRRTLDVTDNGDGTYTGTYVVDAAGSYRLCISQDAPFPAGPPVGSTPYTVTATDPTPGNECSAITTSSSTTTTTTTGRGHGDHSFSHEGRLIAILCGSIGGGVLAVIVVIVAVIAFRRYRRTQYETL